MDVCNVYKKITLMKVIVINNFCIVRQKKTWHKMCIHKISKGSNSLAWILSDLVVVDIIFLISRIYVRLAQFLIKL